MFYPLKLHKKILHYSYYKMLSTFFVDGEQVLKTTDFDEHMLDECNTSILYNFLCEKIPNNNWRDLIFDNFICHDNSMCLYFST